MANSDNINNNTKSDGVVLISQAADILGVSIDTVRRWDKAGTISSTRPDGKNRYFSVEELEKVKLEQPLLISEAAQMLKVSASTLRRLEMRGLIAPIRNGHGERRYDRKTLENFLNSDYFIRQKEVEEEVLEPLKPAPSIEELEPQINQPGVEFAIKRLISEHHINIRKLRERFGLAMGISAAIVIPVFILVGVLTTAFLVNPESTAKKLSLDYASITNSPTMVKAASTDSTQDPAQAVGSDQIKYKPNAGWKDNLRPLVNIALFVVKQVDSQKYAAATKSLKISDVNSIFQPREEGGIQSLYTLFLDSNELNVNDQGLVFNLNSDLLHGKRPGSSAGDIAVLPISGGLGGAITDGSITTVDIADGAITSNKLAPDLNLNVDQNTTTSDLTIDNGLTLTTGALNLTATSGALALSGLSASSINTGANTLTITSSNFNTTATGINSTAIGVTTPAAANFTSIGATTVGTGAFSTISATGQITSTLATGTAPLVISSTTNVANLNASFLNGATFAAPGAIGGGTPSTGAFTTLSATTLAIASITDSSLTTSGVVTNTAAGVLGTLAGTATTVLHGNATGLPSFSSVIGADLAADISVSTTGNILTTGTGTITSAGLLTASGGLTLTTGALNLTATSGALALSGLSASSINTGANTLTITSSNFNTTATGINSTAIGVTTPAAANFTSIGATTVGTGAFSTISATGQITSTLATGTAPLVISSTTNVANLNASFLNGATFAAPGAIGGGTPSTGAFTTLSSSGATDLATAGASNVTIATTGTGTVAIGNATGTFALTSSGGLNVTTAGALTGVVSIDTITTSATAVTFAGAGTVAGGAGIGSDAAGSSLTLAGGAGTGVGSGGNINFQIAPSAAANQSFITGASAPAGVAVNSTFIYWVNNGNSTIGRANLDGTGAVQSFITGGSGIRGIAIDSTYIYWTNASTGNIGRANLDGTGAVQNFITGASFPLGVTVDSTYIYWGSFTSSRVGRANLDGTGVNQNFITTVSGTDGVAVNASFIYWSNLSTNTIGRANLDGTGVNNSFITGASSPRGITVDSTSIYWANSGTNTIARANLDGTGSNLSFATGATNPFGVAVNSTYLYWANWGSTTIGRLAFGATSNDLTTAASISGTNGSLSLISTNTTGLTTSSALSLSANSLTTGTGLYAASSTLTSGLLADLQVSGTAAAASQTALNILTTGANSTAGITTYGAQISNTHSTNTSTNVALYLNASGGATANYGLIVNAGNVGIGTTTPSTPLHVAGTIRSERIGVPTQYVELLSDGGSSVLRAVNTAFEFSVGSQIASQITSTGLVYNIIGQTNPSFKVDGSASSRATGIQVTSQAAGGGIAIAAISSGTNESVTLDAKGAGDIAIGTISTGNVSIGNTTSTVAISGTTTLQFSATTATEKVCGTQTDGTESTGIIRDCSGTPGDYAEEYGSSDPTIEAGDVVALDPARPAYEIIDKDDFKGSKAWVIKASKMQRNGLIGIVSTQPNDVIGKSFDPSENPRPVALSGRLPVKISTENGSIAIGDYLTASSTPGVAMKALKADPVVAIAEAPYTNAGIGKIIAYLHLSYIFGDNIADKIDVNQLSAGLEIVAPKVTTKDLTVGTITPLSDKGLNLELDPSGKFIITNSAGLTTDKTVISFDSLGNASFSGTVTADRIVANQIVGLSVATSGSTNQDANNTALEDLSTRLSTVENQLSFNLTNGVLETQGLTVLGSGLKVDKISATSGAGEISLMGDVSFLGRPYFTSDTAGFAKIAKGQRRVQVTFDKEYVQQPIVNATISISGNDSVNRVTEQTIFDSKVQYVVTDTTTKGFVIVIDKDSPTDVQFSWAALAVKSAKTFSLVPTGDLTEGSGEQGTN